MKLPKCTRCNQPRTTYQLWRGICGSCRRHRCTKHPKGSAACYTRHKCRCDPCRAAANRDKKRYAVRSPLVPVDRVRAHIDMLTAAGFPPSWVAGRIGRAPSYIGYVMTTARRMHPHIARQILALGPDSDGGMVDATGTNRRIRALVANGWPTSWLDARLGLAKGNTHHILAEPQVLHRTAKRYRDLYDDLWDQAPPATTANERGAVTRARRWAERNSFARSMQWDDGTGRHGIDNPAATPYRATSTAKRHGDVADEVRRLLGTDSAEGIAKRLGYATYDTLACVLADRDKPLADRFRATRIEKIA